MSFQICVFRINFFARTVATAAATSQSLPAHSELAAARYVSGKGLCARVNERLVQNKIRFGGKLLSGLL